ncbi:MAG: hypothetical protein QW599_06020 [Nitrososphaerota archaeon]
MVEVILYESLQCPRCARIRPILERVCDVLNIPFIRREADLDPHIWGADEARDTFKPEFLEKHAPDLAQNPTAMSIASLLSRYVQTPTVVLSANLDKPVKILIRGFPAEYDERIRVFERNIYATLKELKEAEKQAWSRRGR